MYFLNEAGNLLKYDNKVTDFYDKEIAKIDSNHTCLAVINLDSVIKKDWKYYIKSFLKKWKFTAKKKKKKRKTMSLMILMKNRLKLSK